MKLVLIPPGEFTMGSPKELIEEELKRSDNDQFYKGRLPGEGPQHRVRITRPFYLGTYLVMQQEYQRVMGTNPSEYSATGKCKDKVAGQDTKRFPVENVSWDDAVEFCRKLSEMPEERSAGRRYVCLRRRSGSMRAVRGAQVGTASVWAGKRFPRNTTRTGFLTTGGSTAIPLGCRTQWVSSGLARGDCMTCMGMFGSGARTGPTKGITRTRLWMILAVPPGGGSRVNRGGSWCNPARCCRSATRCHDGPGNRDVNLGFRVSLILPDTAAGRAKTARTSDATQPSGGCDRQQAIVRRRKR